MMSPEPSRTLPRTWKKSALNNYFYGTIDSLEAAIHEAFTELQQHPETALSLAYTTATNLRKTA